MNGGVEKATRPCKLIYAHWQIQLLLLFTIFHWCIQRANVPASKSHSTALFEKALSQLCLFCGTPLRSLKFSNYFTDPTVATRILKVIHLVSHQHSCKFNSPENKWESYMGYTPPPFIFLFARPVVDRFGCLLMVIPSFLTFSFPSSFPFKWSNKERRLSVEHGIKYHMIAQLIQQR